jgi:hypothetical protein
MRAGRSSWLVAAWKRRLNCLALQVTQVSRKLIVALRAKIFGLIGHYSPPRCAGVAQTGHDLGLDRQLHRGAAEGLGSERTGNAVELEQDPARLHARGPVFDRTLALALTDFSRLLRNRHVREDADPQAALALDVAGDRAAGRFDLASGDPLRFHGLEAVRAEVQIGAALGVALGSGP